MSNQTDKNPETSPNFITRILERARQTLSRNKTKFSLALIFGGCCLCGLYWFLRKTPLKSISIEHSSKTDIKMSDIRMITSVFRQVTLKKGLLRMLRRRVLISGFRRLPLDLLIQAIFFYP